MAGLLGRLGGPLVLSFHRVVPADLPVYAFLNARVGAILPDVLGGVLQLLADSGYTFVPLAESLAPTKRRVATLTFDDGFRDLLDVADPILRRYKCPATAFLITGTVGAETLLWQHRLYLAWPMLSARMRRDVLRRLTLDISAGLGDSVEARLSGALRTSGPSSLEKLSREAAHAAGLSAHDERRFCRALYLREHELKRLTDDCISLGGHGHRHWRASSLQGGELVDDLHRCMDMLTSVSRQPSFDFAIPHGDTGSDIAAAAVRIGFKYVLDSFGVSAPVRMAVPRRVWLWNDISDAHVILSRLWLEQVRRG